MSLVSLNGTLEHTAITFNERHEILCSADIKAQKRAQNNEDEPRAPVDMVAVIDRSGSMYSDLELVKTTISFMIDKLQDGDQFGLVSFGSDSKVELQLSEMSAKGRHYAQEVTKKVAVSGCTNLSDGLFDGIQELHRSTKATNVKSVLLFTDGQANEGITEINNLVSTTKSKLKGLKAGIYCFGYSPYHDETMLRNLSDELNGMYYYVRDKDDIKTSFADCLGGLLTTVASDVTLRVTCSPGVELQEVLGKRTKTKVNETTWDIEIGDIYSEESKNVPLKLKVAKSTSKTNSQPLVTLKLTYTDLGTNKKVEEEKSLTIARVAKTELPLQADPNSGALDEHRNRILVADALDKATQFCNAGKHGDAVNHLRKAVDQLQTSVSSNSNFTQSLIADIKATLANITGQPHHATKYMYSLARALYSQRSSGVSSASATAFVTSGQRSMVGAAGGNADKKNAFFATDTSNVVITSPGASTTATTKTTKAKSSKVLDDSDDDGTDDTDTTSTPAVLDSGLGVDPVFGPITVPRKTRAIRRLLQDFKEIQENPLRTVVARPLDSDLFEWHCNVKAPENNPYGGIVFHLVLQFSPLYPFKAPTLFFCSFIEHPHVFGSWVCLDMLQEAQFGTKEEVDKPYTGWSSAYSVLSILLQLQSFLFDEAGKDPAAIDKARISATKYVCPTSGHKMSAPWPEFPSDEDVDEAQKNYLQLFSKKKSMLKPPVVKLALPPSAAVKQKIVAEDFPSLDESVATPAPVVPKPAPKIVPPVDQTPAQPPAPVFRTPFSSDQEERKHKLPKGWVEEQQESKPQQTQAKALPVQKAKMALPTVGQLQVQKEKEKKEKEKNTPKDDWTTVQKKKPQQPVYNRKKANATNELAAITGAAAAPAKGPKAAPVDNQPSAAVYNAFTLLDTAPSQQTKQTKAAAPAAKPQPAAAPAKTTPQPAPVATPAPAPAATPAPAAAPAAAPAPAKAQQQKQGPSRLIDMQKLAPKPAPAPKAAAPKPQAKTAQQQPAAKAPQQQQFQTQGGNKQKAAPKQAPGAAAAPAKPVVVSKDFKSVDPTSPLYADLYKVLKQKNLKATGFATSFFDYLPENVLLTILSFLPQEDLNKISNVCQEFLRLSGDKWLWNSLFAQRYRSVYNKNLRYLNIQDWKYVFQQENAIGKHGMICFHSKVSFHDDIVGVPIAVDRKNPRFPELTSKLDYLCWEAFTEDNVRKTVWGEPFSHFLPVWINKEHGARAFPYIEEAIKDLTLHGATTFTPQMALIVLPRLMNSMVVSVMSGNIHASLKALEGYCMFHRILLEFVTRYPELQDSVNEKVRKFIQDDNFRHKNSTPNLGEFLPQVAVSSLYSWDDVALPYIEENFTRNALWIIKRFPRMANLSRYTPGSVDRDRLNKSFEASTVSLRLLAFHVFFFRNFARPPGVTMRDIMDNYDRFYGLPSQEMKVVLQRKIFEILKINNWPSLFKAVGMDLPSQENLTTWLVQSVVNSEKKGYHRKAT